MNPRQGRYQLRSRPPAFLLALYSVVFSSVVSHAGQPGSRSDTQPAALLVAAGAPGSIKDEGLPFSYALYCSEQGLFTYDGAARALVERPEHLRRVYMDAAQGHPRAKVLVRELEKVFHDLGTLVADKTTKPGCLLLPEVTPECRLNWQFLNDFLGSTTEAQHLRDVTIHAYEVEARKRGAQNAVIIEAVKLLGALGVAAAASEAAVVPARPPAANVAVERAAPLESAAGSGPRVLSRFAKSTVDDVVESSGRLSPGGQITEGARAIGKKLGHAQSGGYASAFAGVKPTQADAEAIIRSTLENPARTFYGDKVIDVYNAAGQGVRFDRETNTFRGFLEGGLATQ